MRESLLISGAIGLAVFMAILLLYVLSLFLGANIVALATLAAAGAGVLAYVVDMLTERE